MSTAIAMKYRIALVILSLFLSVLIGLSLSRSGEPGRAAPSRQTASTGPAASTVIVAPGLQHTVQTTPAAAVEPFPSIPSVVSAAPQPLLIGLSMDTLKEERWLKDRDLFVAKAEELGAKVHVLEANGNDVQQVRDVESLITLGVDVLVIIPHDGKAMASSVRKAQQEGIPVLAYDRLITDCDLDLYVTFDNVKVGELQAQWLVDHLPTPGQGKIARIYGAPTDNNAKLFKQGQDKVIEPLVKSGAIQVVHEDWAQNWDPSNAKKIANAALTRAGKDFHGILASNDGTAGGAVQALKEEGLEGKILVTGQDADLVACQRIAAGSQSMTIYKPIQKIALKAAELAVSLAAKKAILPTATTSNGAKEVPTVLLEVQAVDAKNLEQTVIADGVYTKDQVYQ